MSDGETPKSATTESAITTATTPLFVRWIRKTRLEANHRRCLLTTHDWVAGSYNPMTGDIVVYCNRCFPHKRSARVNQRYDLKPTPNTGE